MLNFHTKRLIQTGALIIALLLLFGCDAKNPGEPLENRAPDTYISVASPGNVTSISWYGTDRDGFAEVFYYQWDGDADWTETTELTATFQDVFANTEDVRTFFVYSEDNAGSADQTPASVTLSPSNAEPETEITSGPEFGSKTGEDVTFRFSGRDFDDGGEVESFRYTLDDLNNWIEVDVDAAFASFRGLNSGSHTFYVKAVDNLEAEDSTPASVTFIVEGGAYRPQITNTSPVADGGGWFAGAGLTFSFSVNVADYYGELAEKAYSYGYDDNTNYNDDAVEPLSSGWIAGSSFAVAADQITSGEHTFYVKVRDVSRSVSKMTISFNVAAPTFDQGILLVDDFNWAPDGYADDADIDDKIAHGFMADYPFTQRPDDAAALTPDDLAPYSTVIIYGDWSFTNQNNGNLIAAYAAAGGNVMICSYHLEAIAPSFAGYGIYDSVYGTGSGNYGGMDGQEGTAYENFHINLPAEYDERDYQRVYDDASNTQSIFAVRGLNGDDRSCGVRAEMPLGNVVIVMGQSIPFWDQTSADTRAFGEYVLGTEFGESR